MKKSLIIVPLVLIAAGVAGYFVYQHYRQSQNPYAALQTTAAAKGDVAQVVTASGNTAGLQDVNIFLDTSQTVDHVLVKEGDVVHKGDVLATYDIAGDQADLDRQLRQAQLNLKNAQLNLQSITLPAEGNELLQYQSDITTAQKNLSDAQNAVDSGTIKLSQQLRKVDDAQKDLDNAQTLLNSGATTQTAYDQANSALKTAQDTLADLQVTQKGNEDTLANRVQQLSDAQQKLANAQNKLSDDATAVQYAQQQNTIALTNVQIEQIVANQQKLAAQSVSPVSGAVTAVRVNDGGAATKGAALFTVTDLSSMLVQADVSEYDAPQLQLGQQADVTYSGLPGRIFSGKVTKIAAQAVKRQKSSGDEVVVPVEVTLDSEDPALKAGYDVDLTFYIARRAGVLVVPVAAVFTEDNQSQSYVYLLSGDKLDQLEKRAVTAGLSGGKNVEITSGLAAGEMVVTDPGDVK